MNEKQIALLVILSAAFIAFVILANILERKTINGIKSKTVGDGQYGTARWAAKSEIRQTFSFLPFEPQKWRKGEALPTIQGTVIGCRGKANTTALVDTGDVHTLMIGAAGKYTATGIHINFDSRLSLNGDNKAVQPGEAIMLCNSRTVKIDDDTIFVMTAGISGDGDDGIMWSFPLIIPSDCQTGDVYPIQIEYINNGATMDQFSNAPPYYEREQDQLMEAWVFTKGIVQGYIKIKEENTAPVDCTLGDVDNDGKINAVDASAVLAYYAMLSTGQDGGFTEAQKLASDVDNDGKINAVDASCILAYYAYISTGGKDSLEDFLNKPTINDFPLYNSRLNYIKANSKTVADCINTDISTQYSYSTEKKYALIDLNGDKSPELIITSGESNINKPIVVEIYTIDNNRLLRICQSQERLAYYLCENNVVASSGALGQQGGDTYYRYINGSELSIIEGIGYDYSSGHAIWTYSDEKTRKNITEFEAESIRNKYKGINYELTPF